MGNAREVEDIHMVVEKLMGRPEVVTVGRLRIMPGAGLFCVEQSEWGSASLCRSRSIDHIPPGTEEKISVHRFGVCMC